MFTFKIIEENENPLETIIEMGGVTTKFTMQQVLDHLEYTTKVLRETKAQLEAQKIQDQMAVEILPILKEIPEDKWNLVMAYSARQVQYPESEGLIETSEKTLKAYEERKAQIKEAIGIDADAKPLIVE